jgi:hypothetical protein
MDTVISRELPEDYLQNIFSNMERTNQNKYLHKISLRRKGPGKRIISGDFIAQKVSFL